MSPGAQLGGQAAGGLHQMGGTPLVGVAVIPHLLHQPPAAQPVARLERRKPELQRRARLLLQLINPADRSHTAGGHTQTGQDRDTCRHRSYTERTGDTPPSQVIHRQDTQCSYIDGHIAHTTRSGQHQGTPW